MTSEPASPPLSVLRKLLAEFFLAEVDFDAFCLDSYPEVHKRFATGMDRVSKTNWLLELTAPAQVVKVLELRYAKNREQRDLITRHLAADSEEAAKARAHAEELERLYIARDTLRLLRTDTVALDEQIVAAKRAFRQFPQLQAGEVLSDRYKLLEVIGKGGFARIWQAYDRKEQRLVALKILHSESSDEPRRVQRFTRGAQQMKGLSHPSIVRVLDGPDMHRQFHYFVMDYFPGGDLSRAVISGKILRKDALRGLLDIGAALAHAHARHVIHRDIKPQNILLDGHDKAHLTDFDLVWAPDTTGGTATGFLGTYAYVAPEQAEDAKSVDERVDIYALGMTVLFVLYGRALPPRAVHQRALFIDGFDCEAPLKALLLRATASDPEDRPRSIDAFCSELSRALHGNPPWTAVETATIVALASEPPVPIQRDKDERDEPGRRRSSIAIIFGAIMLLALALGGAFWLFNRPARVEQEAKAKQIYDRFAESVRKGDYDLALTDYRQIPDDSVFRQFARQQYEQIFPRFIENHLTAAEEARVAGKCAEFNSHIQAILNNDPRHAYALAAQKRLCVRQTHIVAPSPPAAAAVAGIVAAAISSDTHESAEKTAPVESPVDVERILSEAQTQYVEGNFSKAIKKAKSVEKSRPLRAWRIIGDAACNLKDLRLVNDAYRRLDEPGRQHLIDVCLRNGFQNTGNQFWLPIF